MQEDTSILTLDANPPGTDGLQQSARGNGRAIKPQQHEMNASLKLIETEHKLKQVFEEYSGRIESFMLMLDTFKEGTILVNQAGEVCYANEAGNLLMQEITACNPQSNLFAFAVLQQEKNISVKPDALTEILIRINNFTWNDELCNIFLLNKTVLKNEVVLSSSSNASPLSEPFDALIKYVQLISEHEANGKLPEAAACAELAGKTVLQTERLLGDVKTFIALANHQPAFAQVSMQKIVGDVLKSMGPEIEEAEIEVSVSDLPDTTADKELALKLIKHLVHNALKFRNKSRKAVIDIGHDKSDGQYIFCVRDNGIGISKKHHELVFNLFSTLNDTEEYPGNGIGLAICKKIVELHDGKIWVESLPGHGSNFYFKLNAKK